VSQAVCRDPQPHQPAHGLVVGKKTQGCQRTLARASRWVRGPDGGCEPPYL
jgi:hypothetical protein